MPAQSTFRLTVESEIQSVSMLTLADLPFRREDRWWAATSIKGTRTGLTVWATEVPAPTCEKMQCGSPVTKLLTVSDSIGRRPFYRCDKCARADERTIPLFNPGATVVVVALNEQAEAVQMVLSRAADLIEEGDQASVYAALRGALILLRDEAPDTELLDVDTVRQAFKARIGGVSLLQWERDKTPDEVAAALRGEGC